LSGILGRGIDDALQPKRGPQWELLTAEVGMRALHRGSRFLGTVVKVLADGVVIQGASGDERAFRFIPGAFIVNGATVSLTARVAGASGTPMPAGPQRTASGSFADTSQQGKRAKVARGSRIWVEGIHDAALVEKVWGDDLRGVGVVVERLDGIDDLANEVDRFGPGSDARLGVLVDHLVAGSKESRIAERVENDFVCVRGTPYVDVWQAIRPKVVGIDAWPQIPRNEEWKQGIVKRIAPKLDTAEFWRRILASVKSYADLEPSFVGAIEELLDFVLDADE
jgi:Protein of unknown function (DUF3097)